MYIISVMCFKARLFSSVKQKYVLPDAGKPHISYIFPVNRPPSNKLSNLKNNVGKNVI